MDEEQEDFVFEEAPYVLFRLRGPAGAPDVWRIAEDDRVYGQYPFCYVIQGEQAVVFIDTGTGTGNIFEFARKGAPELFDNGRKILVACTHTHYDHCGCNRFCCCPRPGGGAELAAFCTDICVSAADPAFSEDAAAAGPSSVAPEDATSEGRGPGDKVLKPYRISRWLRDGEELDLGAGRKLQAFHCPGHTPDSMALYDASSKSCFVGDTVYRWCPIFVSGPGADLRQLRASLARLSAALPADARLRCGHLDPCLERGALDKLAGLCDRILRGEAAGERVAAAGGSAPPTCVYSEPGDCPEYSILMEGQGAC